MPTENVKTKHLAARRLEAIAYFIVPAVEIPPPKNNLLHWPLGHISRSHFAQRSRHYEVDFEEMPATRGFGRSGALPPPKLKPAACNEDGLRQTNQDCRSRFQGKLVQPKPSLNCRALLKTHLGEAPSEQGYDNTDDRAKCNGCCCVLVGMRWLPSTRRVRQRGITENSFLFSRAFLILSPFQVS